MPPKRKHTERRFHGDIENQDKVKKKCMKCGAIYYDVPGPFASPNPDKPQSGLCPKHRNTTMLNEDDFGVGMPGVEV